MIRRTLLLASMVVLFWAAPAYATHTYDHVLPTTLVPPSTIAPPTTEGPEVEATSQGPGVEAGGNLARTGSNSIVPLVQAAIVLMGGGTLLVLVARRRHAVRRAATV